VSPPSDTREQFRPPEHPTEHFLMTTVVGSYPKPKWLNRADELHEDPDHDFGDEQLREAHDEGLAIPEIERILRQSVFADMRNWEAERAARSSGTTAANHGALSSYQDAGAVGKEWQAEDDHRTRDSHAETDGQTVAINQAFQTGAGNAAQYPGDPSLPLSDRMWCRCSIGPTWDL